MRFISFVLVLFALGASSAKAVALRAASGGESQSLSF
jgi:hypothetical protein